MNHVARPLIALALILVNLALTGCSGGGDRGGGNAGPGGGGQPTPWAIEDAAAATMGTDLLFDGDMFMGETDPAQATVIGDRIWAVLTSRATWTADNPLYTYQFYVDTDPVTNWGRAFRYTGFNVEAGPITTPPTFFGTGTYVAPNGQQYDAVILRTWDISYWELLVVENGAAFVHAIQNANGLPIAQTYRG